jgi:hypothetical protein
MSLAFETASDASKKNEKTGQGNETTWIYLKTRYPPKIVVVHLFISSMFP